METSGVINVRFHKKNINLKQQHNRLYSKEKAYKAFIELSPDAIIVHTEGIITEVNNRALRLFGTGNRGELIGKPLLNFIHSGYHSIAENRIKEAENSDVFAPFIEEKFLRLDGGSVDVEVTVIRFPYKGKYAYMSVVREISERKKVQEDLNLKAQLLDAVTDSVVLHDLEGNFIYLNEAAYKSHGYSKEEMMNLTLFDLDTQEYAELIPSRATELLENGQLFFESAHISKEKSVIPVEVHAKAITTEGKKLILSISHDISERKKAEQLTKDNENNIKMLGEALEFNKLRTEFFANISHELRTPLNIILGTVQLLNLDMRSGIVSITSKDIVRHVKVIKHNCYRLLRLINNLIDITRIDSGYLKPDMHNCNIVEVIEDITQSAVQYAESNGLTLVFDTDVEEKLMACDPEKMERLILNLLSNAVKFTEPGGSITVNIHDMKEKIAISVKDTGIGIPEDKQDLIFERFVQVDNLLTRHHDGSGIGLSIVKSLVEMHNGTICVKSQLGKGSEFITELPVKILHVENENSKYRFKQIQRDQIDRVFIEFSDICTVD